MRFPRVMRDIAKRETIDNYLTGWIAGVNFYGRFTVETELGLLIKADNAGGQELEIGDAVAIRLINGDINTAEIVGKTTIKKTREAHTFWR